MKVFLVVVLGIIIGAVFTSLFIKISIVWIQRRTSMYQAEAAAIRARIAEKIDSGALANLVSDILAVEDRAMSPEAGAHRIRTPLHMNPYEPLTLRFWQSRFPSVDRELLIVALDQIYKTRTVYEKGLWGKSR